MNTVKHTPGLWSVVNSTVYLLNARGTNRLTVAVMPGRTDEDKRVSDEEVLEIAQRIGRFLNSHDELVEALKDMLRIARAASIGISGNQPRIARAEAAIAKATGGAA